MVSETRLARGKDAEDRACSILEEKGFEILGRNVKSISGELDIVARKGDCLVVVEVRSRRPGSAVLNSEIVGYGKRKKVVNVAREVIVPYLKRGDSVRFDVVLIGFDKKGRLVDWEHIPNAFSSTGEII